MLDQTNLQGKRKYFQHTSLGHKGKKILPTFYVGPQKFKKKNFQLSALDYGEKKSKTFHILSEFIRAIQVTIYLQGPGRQKKHEKDRTKRDDSNNYITERK